MTKTNSLTIIQWKRQIDSRDCICYIVPEKLWTEVLDIIQKAVIKTIHKKKKFKKAKWLSEEALQIAEKRKAREKGKDITI